MRWLEHRIPPPLVALACAAGMAACAPDGTTLVLPDTIRAGLLGVFVLLGLALDLYAVVGFVRARTTVNPLQPAKATTLVISGPYRITRNPMYLGMSLLLCAAWVWWPAPWNGLWIVLFVAFITRFQIVPEERAMQAQFGEEFATYQARVRRWI